MRRVVVEPVLTGILVTDVERDGQVVKLKIPVEQADAYEDAMVAVEAGQGGLRYVPSGQRNSTQTRRTCVGGTCYEILPEDAQLGLSEAALERRERARNPNRGVDPSADPIAEADIPPAPTPTAPAAPTPTPSAPSAPGPSSRPIATPR